MILGDFKSSNLSINHLFLMRGKRNGLQSIGLYKTTHESLRWLEKKKEAPPTAQITGLFPWLSQYNEFNALGIRKVVCSLSAASITGHANILALRNWNITVAATK